MNFGDVTDGVRDLVEDVVVEGVSADEVAEGREGRKFFLDVVFDVEHMVACREPNMTVICPSKCWQVSDKMPACPLSLSMVERLSAPMLLIMAW